MTKRQGGALDLALVVSLVVMLLVLAKVIR